MVCVKGEKNEPDGVGCYYRSSEKRLSPVALRQLVCTIFCDPSP